MAESSTEGDLEDCLTPEERHQRRVAFIKWLCGAIDAEAHRRNRGIR